MGVTTLSVVIPVRNRSGVRLENCLRSIRWQDIRQSQVDIVISDFGSSPEQAVSVQSLADRYGAVVARTRTNEMWNRSRALNIGIQEASGEWVLCTDADMIFAPNFVETVLTVLRSTPRAMVHCGCHDLPENIPEQLWGPEDFPDLHCAATLRSTQGTGACQAAAKAFFFDVRGYDEAFRYWGAEDVDMSRRAERYGLELAWITSKTSMLHQWHVTMKHDKRWLYRLNKWRYRLTSHIVVKNRRGWGRLA